MNWHDSMAQSVSLQADSNGNIILSVTVGTDTLATIISKDLLLGLRESAADILEPDRVFQRHLKELKKNKRDFYLDFQRETDPELREQRRQLYVEAKQLVIDLEQGRE